MLGTKIAAMVQSQETVPSPVGRLDNHETWPNSVGNSGESHYGFHTMMEPPDMKRNETSVCQPLSRRNFLSASVLAAAGGSALLANPAAAGQADNADKQPRRVNIFSKHLQWLDYKGMAEVAAEVGFDGIDLTVRPNGHVEPERVADDLPRAVEAVKQAGLRVEMIVSSVTDPQDELTEKVLKTAASVGVQFYRMGYYRFEKSGDIRSQLAEIKPALRDLVAMNKHFGLAATYQNHAGERYVGAALWDLYFLIHNLDPQYIGSQYDIRHAAAEGGTAWGNTLRLLSQFVNTLAIKDYIWEKTDKGWRPGNVPLGAGMVDFPKYKALLDDLQIDVPVTLHIEYPIAGANHGARKLTGDKSIVLNAMRSDLAFVRKLFAS